VGTWHAAVEAAVRREAEALGVDAGVLLADRNLAEALAELADLEPGTEALDVGVAAAVGHMVEAGRAVPAGAAMVAAMLPADVAEAVAVDGGLPPEQLHVTLAYLGEELTAEQREAAGRVTGEVAGRHPRLAGQLGGLGQFPAGEDGVPVFAPVDVPGMVELRQDLVRSLAAAGLPVPAEHDFTPHATLTYLAGEGEATPEPVPPTPVEFAALTFAQGRGERVEFPLGAREAAAGGVTEVRDRMVGRVVEARGTDGSGGRVFRVRIIQWGQSRNRRSYTQPVMAAAARLYEGAKAYDHHRSPEELKTSTINGLVGQYRHVTVEADGLYADLHLLPGATHAAEALDASLAAQARGLPPLVGISHDVLASYRPVNTGRGRVEEATAILKVNSADIVADPAAGGMPTRMLAGGTAGDDDDPQSAGESEEGEVPIKKADVLAALRECDDQELAGVGLSRAPAGDAGAPAAAPAAGAVGGDGASAAAPAPAAATEAVRGTEAGTMPKAGFLGQMMIRHKVESAGLPIGVVPELTKALPEQVTESVVDAQVAALQAGIGVIERAGLVGASVLGASGAKVTKEATEKKATALDKFFEGDYRAGYRSFREAWADFTGYRPQQWGEDLNRRILRESFGGGFDSAAVHGTESLDSTSWAQVLGDSITRRMIAMYSQPSLSTWRKIVSDVIPVTDFRQQRRERVGGYGLLPVVAEGAPYAPLASPTDEEAVYSIIKRGGLDDLTLEMIANDDLGAIRNVPRGLGLAAAITLYRFIWDILATNTVCTYDTVALFNVAHNNTATAALSSTALSAARQRMRQQAAFGQATNILSLRPRTLIVPSALEELAFQLVTSAVAITTNSDATIPNLHAGLDLEVIDYFTDADDWFLAGDPAMVPTIEVGFYQGREDPELFTQADENVGSMFNADKLTYKIRHIYSGTPLDHRGFQRGTQP
jgi:2'-5' RNA ligase